MPNRLCLILAGAWLLLSMPAGAGGAVPLDSTATPRDTLSAELDSLATSRDTLPANGDSLCAEGDAWPMARRAFLNEAVRNPEVEDCRDFRLSAAYPSLDGVVWESLTYAFLFDPRTGYGFLLPRPAAEQAYVWRDFLDPPPPLDPFRLAWLADRFRPEALEAGRMRCEQVRAWADPHHPVHPLFGLLGLGARLEQAASLGDEVFLARHAAQPSFAAAVDSLIAAHRDHGFMSGIVRDGARGEPLAGVRIVFSMGDRSDTVVTGADGVYGAAFAGEAGRPYRVSATREGYQTLLLAGVLAGRHLAGRDMTLNPEPRPFLITGRVRGGMEAGGSVAGTVVTARSKRGTASKFVTGADGHYRLTLLIPRPGDVEVVARKGNAAAGARLTAAGNGRTGIDLRLRRLSPDGRAEMVEIPPLTRDDDPAAADADPPFVDVVPRAADAASGALLSETPGADYAFVSEGDPFTQTGESGGCAAGLLSLELDALTFPSVIHPGGTYTLEVGVHCDAGRAGADTARVLVKAFFFDATPQRRELLFTDTRSRMVTFTFTTDEVDLGHPSGRVGVGAGGVFECERGEPSERVVTALQSYSRREGITPAGPSPAH